MRNRFVLLGDVLLLLAGSMAAFAIRFEAVRETTPVLVEYHAYLILSLFLRLTIFWMGGLYRCLWRYAGIQDLFRLLLVTSLAGLTNLLLGALALPGLGVLEHRVPLAVLALDLMATVGLPSLLRLSLRRQDRRRSSRIGRERRKHVLIAGAGDTGRLIAQQLSVHPDLDLRLVGFLDDDLDKQSRSLLGVPVLGSLSQLPDIAEATKADELILAMPRASGEVIRQVAELAAELKLSLRTVPEYSEILAGRTDLASLRPIEIGDLLRRPVIDTDLDPVAEMIGGKRILVTGAGGSIGLELCRQIASFQPAQLLLLGHGEYSIYQAQRELQQRFPGLSSIPVISDIRDRDRTERIFKHFRPELVFHAAAHKHVPLMEDNPCEAVTNNVLGTRLVVEMAQKVGAERLVMISTDKVVNPTSVMGATKRIAEQVVQVLGQSGSTRCSAVRFGNVLGSRGSVVPLFLEQIRLRQSITITDPEVRRYFMTIPEAVQLVLQAMTLGQGGEVFALDMGEPIRIADLANDLIQLSGLEVGRDIPIVFTGLRPGEKLYEDIFFDGEFAEPTQCPKVMRSRLTAPGPELLQQVDELLALAEQVVPGEVIRAAIKGLVPEFTGGDTGLSTAPPLATTGSPGAQQHQPASAAVPVS